MATFRILVVDDEEGIRLGTRRILSNFRVDYPFMDEQVEYELSEAASGEEAIRLIEAQAPDILLLDNKLPGMEGIEVLEYVRKRQLDILVVMITSYASLELAVKATRDGAYDFIPKPFTPQELRSSLENITKHLFLKRMTRKMHQEGKQIRFQFLSVLSHELKAPLNAIEGYVRMIRERELGGSLDDYTESLDRIQQRIQGMRNLILDLLDLTRIESGKRVRKLVSLDPATIARTALDTLRPYAIQKEVGLNLKAPDGMLFTADADELEIVFNNLISNAVKYNKTGGHVDCILEAKESGLHIQVKDTGIGMSPEESERLFGDFVRIQNARTRDISGSGLGLSIVKKILDQYGASIRVESIPEQGSNFIIFIPNNQPTNQT
jgi:signal transduction histidine kinase